MKSFALVYLFAIVNAYNLKKKVFVLVLRVYIERNKTKYILLCDSFSFN